MTDRKATDAARALQELLADPVTAALRHELQALREDVARLVSDAPWTKPVLESRDCAAYFPEGAVTYQTVRDWLRRYDVPHRRVGNYVTLRRDVWEAFLAGPDAPAALPADP